MNGLFDHMQDIIVADNLYSSSQQSYDPGMNFGRSILEVVFWVDFFHGSQILDFHEAILHKLHIEVFYIRYTQI